MSLENPPISKIPFSSSQLQSNAPNPAILITLSTAVAVAVPVGGDVIAAPPIPAAWQAGIFGGYKHPLNEFAFTFSILKRGKNPETIHSPRIKLSNNFENFFIVV